MTRRIIIFPLSDGAFLASQEFNGDLTELVELKKLRRDASRLCMNWPAVVARFEGVRTEQDFWAALRDAETWYGYEQMKPELLDALPNAEEVWAVQDGHLVLAARYGEKVNMAEDQWYYALQDEVKASLHKLRDGMVYMMLDAISLSPMPWADGRHNYNPQDFKMEVGGVSEFMPMYGNEKPVYTAMMRVK